MPSFLNSLKRGGGALGSFLVLGKSAGVGTLAGSWGPQFSSLWWQRLLATPWIFWPSTCHYKNTNGATSQEWSPSSERWPAEGLLQPSLTWGCGASCDWQPLSSVPALLPEWEQHEAGGVGRGPCCALVLLLLVMWYLQGAAGVQLVKHVTDSLNDDGACSVRS